MHGGIRFLRSRMVFSIIFDSAWVNWIVSLAGGVGWRGFVVSLLEGGSVGVLSMIFSGWFGVEGDGGAVAMLGGWGVDVGVDWSGW